MDNKIKGIWLFNSYYTGKCSNCGYIENTDLDHYPVECKGCGADMSCEMIPVVYCSNTKCEKNKYGECYNDTL